MKKVLLTGTVLAVFGAAAVLAVALSLMAGGGAVARANPDPVLAGYDLFETGGGGPTFTDLTTFPIPADKGWQTSLKYGMSDRTSPRAIHPSALISKRRL